MVSWRGAAMARIVRVISRGVRMPDHVSYISMEWQSGSHICKENYVPMDRDMMNQEGWKLSIMPGATVYDVNGDKVGTAQQYNPQLDCLVVEKGILFTKDIYIPASTIESSDANGIRVALSKDELKDERYTQPPTPGTTGMGRAANPDYLRERDLNDNLDLP